MRMIVGGALACALIAGCTHTGSKMAADPAAATTAFYDAVTAMPAGGVPDAAGQAKLAPLVTAELAEKLAAARAAEDAHTAATNNQEPPMLQGDIFGSLFEGRTGFVVADCVESGSAVNCEVAQSYSDASGNTEWTDTAVLVQQGGSWKVADVIYGGDWDFASKGRLSETLTGVAAGE